MSEYHTKRTKRKNLRRKRAHRRLRNRIRGTAERPRLAVFKSLKYVYAQLIDDQHGITLVAASSVESSVRAALTKSAGSREAARAVGERLAERATEKGVKKVVFDRGGYIYHGKIEEVAKGARSKGLDF